jgi:hypothetical protein
MASLAACFGLTIIAISIFLVPFATAENTQEFTLKWSNTYGPYCAFSIIQTADGGYVLAGQNASFKTFEPHSLSGWVNYTALALKIDKNGTIIWKKSYEAQVGYGLYENGAVSLVQTEDLGYALCGSNWLLKVDSFGSVLWTKIFANLSLVGVIQTSDGGYALLGKTEVGYRQSVDSLLIKTDNFGTVLWNTTFSSGLGFDNDVVAGSFVQTNDNGFAIAGSWHNAFWFALTDTGGNLIFNQTYNPIPNFGAGFHSLSKTSEGGYVLGGYDSNPFLESSFYSGWVYKIDGQGNVQWTYHLQLPGFGDQVVAAKETTDGGFVAVGTPELIKLDSTGRLEWNATYYNAFSVDATKDNGFAVAGEQGISTGPDQKLWAAQFDSKSNISPTPSVPELSFFSIVTLSFLALSATVLFFVRRLKRSNGIGKIISQSWF